MKWLAYQRVPISSLRLPGNIAARQGQAHVVELAADLRELGDEPINCPVVDGQRRLIAGGDRIAALLLNGAKHCWVRSAEVTEQEFADVRDSENLFRRVDDRNALIARRVRKVIETIAAERSARGTNVPVAETRQDVTKARAKVARQLGTTPCAVRKAEQRAAQEIPQNIGALGGEPGAPPLPPPVLCPIDRIGAEPSREFSLRVAGVRDAIQKANLLVQQAQREIAPLADQALYPGAAYQRLKAQLHTAAANIRYSNPGLTCPYCKDPDGLLGRRADCPGCWGLGYLLEEQRAAVPRELFDAGALAGKAERRQAISRRIRIQDGAGNDLDIGEAAFDDGEPA